ncbi:MAG: hypothetical protein Q4G03_04170 [Planctomycetia bacterium]|nr:hypothetical protein [Planctomycetia bacterium]
MSDSAKPFTEALIINNPMYYRDLAPDAFDLLIQDGTWIPVVLNSVKNVVERHFFPLCELNWDYLRNETRAPENYSNYKMIHHIGLNEEQCKLVRLVADEIETEILTVAQETVNAKNAQEDEE